MTPSRPIGIEALGGVCHLGGAVADIAANLFAHPEVVCDVNEIGPLAPPKLTGAVTVDLPDSAGWPVAWQSRNNQLLAQAAQPILGFLDAHPDMDRQRIAIVLGTSTSGIGEAELHLRDDGWNPPFHYAQQEMGAPCEFLAWYLGVSGVAWTISTACSSGAKAMAAAARLLNADMADWVIAGGADSLCAFTLNGFAALGATSAGLCNPFAEDRDGINIGEGAALFLLSRSPTPIQLLGWGESADAYHLSAPEPSASGALSAVNEALVRAQLSAADIDYINAHGTGTEHNDAMEAVLIGQLGLHSIPVSSTKARTGHTLGAAGAIEALIAYLALDRQRIPAANLRGAMMDAAMTLATENEATHPIRHVLSTSFAFGGSNAALILGTREPLADTADTNGIQ